MEQESGLVGRKKGAHVSLDQWRQEKLGTFHCLSWWEGGSQRFQ